jgi:hypothetical protein
MLSRKRTTFKLSLALIAMGAVTMLMTVLSANDMSPDAFFDRFELAALWFIAAGHLSAEQDLGQLASEPDRCKKV